MKYKSRLKRFCLSVALLIALLLPARFGYATHVHVLSESTVAEPFDGAASVDPNKQGKANQPDSYLTEPNEEELLEIALRYIKQHKGALGLTSADLADVLVTDQYSSKHNAVTHIYLRQRFEGIEVFNANLNLNIARDGSVLNMNSSFMAQLERAVEKGRAGKQSVQLLSASEAIESAAQHLGLTITERLEVQAPSLQSADDATNEVLFSDAGISQRDIPAKLIYQPLENGALRLAWNLEIYQTDAQNYWAMRVDAATGKVLDQVNWVSHELWDTPADTTDGFAHTPNLPVVEQPVASKNLALLGQYRVYAMPLESPSHGSRSLVSTPADALASPFGWHDTNGATGAEFTITRGNNVYAYEDSSNSGSGYSPNGGANLQFDFPLDLRQVPSSYQDAAITNLFYWNNIIHDLFYRYGFDEVSGNFQENNYSRGGWAGDVLKAEAQDGSGMNNANFATPPDGLPPRMQMYLWNRTTPSRDGGFDHGIIMHEYGHGISIRLTGGPSNSSCLWNQEQGGEGWSDWFALMMTMKAGDMGSQKRAIGTYVMGQASNGNGIRPAPYTTEMEINGYTYGDIVNQYVPHGVGFIWGTILWEMNWALIEAHGWDADLYTGTGGNNMALQLVVDGLKLQPCTPGFVDARDAILLADEINHGGANECLLWQAFAKRGLGFSAKQGSQYSIADGSEAFDTPPSCESHFTIQLAAGWNLVSLPLQPAESDISDLLAPIAGNYELVHAYTGCNPNDPWQKYDPNGPPFANDLTNVDETMALWINMTITDTLLVHGTAPATTIPLCQGWNLVGYPSSQEEAVSDVLSPIMAELSLVYAYNPIAWTKYDPSAPPFVNTLYQMQPGLGYWIEVHQETILTIDN